MDRVLLCTAQVKTKQRELSRETVMDLLCASNRARADAQAARVSFTHGNRKPPEIFIDMMYYMPGPNDVFINRMVASATAKMEIVDTGEEKPVTFSHVEMSFPCDTNNRFFDNKKTMGFSIVQNSTVYFRLKSWREEYTAIRIYLDAAVYAKLYQTCALLALQHIKFDSFGMYAAVLLPVEILRLRSRQIHGTYCSKIITEVLQQFGIGGALLSASVACQSTPSLLYMFLGGRSSRDPPT